jgi:hypothetical protein
MVGMSSDAVAVTFDVGTSSVRTLAFNFAEQVRYQFTTSADGGVEFEASRLLEVLRSLLTIHVPEQAAGLRSIAGDLRTRGRSALRPVV